MKRTPLSHLVIIISTLALAAGCSTTTQVIEVQPPSTGKIEGSVQLVEMDCSPSASSAGVTVNLLGTAHSAQTDSAGNWVLDSVPAGYYTMHIFKPGFEEYYDGLFPFVGAGTDIFARGLTLARIRNWIVTLSPVTVARNIFIGPSYSDTSFAWVDTPKVVDTLGTDHSQYPNLFYFVGKRPSVNYANHSSWFYYDNTSVGAGMPIGGPNAHSGDTLYMVAYQPTCDDGTMLNYYSGDTLKTVWTGLGPPSNVVKFVLP